MKRIYDTEICSECGSTVTYDVTGWSVRVTTNIEAYEREGIGTAFWDMVEKETFDEYYGLISLVEGAETEDGKTLDVYLFNKRQAADLGRICYDDENHADGLTDGKVYLAEFVRDEDGQTVYELSSPDDIIDYLNGKKDGLRRVSYNI